MVLSGLHIGQMFPLEHGRKQVVGRSQSADIRLADVGISRHHVAIIPDENDELWVEDMSSRNGTYCNGHRIGRQLLDDGDKIQLGRSTMLRFTYVDEFDETFQRLMYNSALRDGLTRAFNRRYFTERLDAEFHFARRHKTPLSLLLLDLDHFKRINDEYGHVAGDHVLMLFCEAVQANVRNEDVFARFGGEEFAVISRSITAAGASQFGERLRHVIEELPIYHEGDMLSLTVSVGISAVPEFPAQSPLDLIEAADKALYRAKRTGRNKVCTYDPALDSTAQDGRKSSDETQPL